MGTVEARSLKSGTQQKENELLCKAHNSRKSSHASLVATQHRGKHISVAVSRHATIAATFSERSALTNSKQRCVLRVSDSSVDRRDQRQFSGSMGSRSRSSSMSMASEASVRVVSRPVKFYSLAEGSSTVSYRRDL
jgi:hypothetical protein